MIKLMIVLNLMIHIYISYGLIKINIINNKLLLRMDKVKI